MSAWRVVIVVVAGMSCCMLQGCGGGGAPPSPPPPQPPVWPARFSVKFNESASGFGNHTSTNKGEWLYDVGNNRAVYSHGDGHENNFCSCANKSAADKQSRCDLVFAADKWMYVVFPELKTCCKLCNASEGCSPLRRDWLVNGTKFMGSSTIAGRECNTWCKKGAVADDCWSATADDAQLPCEYHETFGFAPGALHKLTFDEKSYTTEPIDPAKFVVDPDGCEACPLVFGKSCG